MRSERRVTRIMPLRSAALALRRRRRWWRRWRWRRRSNGLLRGRWRRQHWRRRRGFDPIGSEALANCQSNRPRLPDVVAETRAQTPFAVKRQLRVDVEDVVDVTHDLEPA